MQFLENRVHVSNIIHFVFSYVISMFSLYYFMRSDEIFPFLVFAVFSFYSLLKLCAILSTIIVDIMLFNIDSRLKGLVHILGNYDNMNRSGEVYASVVDKIIDFEDQEDEENGE